MKALEKLKSMINLPKYETDDRYVNYSVYCKQICKSFGMGKSVIKNCDLGIQKGETFVLAGASGCGKSVLMKIIIGLMQQDSGQVFVNGKENKSLDDVAVVFQNNALFDDKTIVDNISFILEQKGIDKKTAIEKAESCLESVGLTNHVHQLFPQNISGGMARRVSISRALAVNPKILILDEPTAGLDINTSYLVSQLLSDIIAKRNLTALVLTHDVVLVSILRGRIGVLSNGKVVTNKPNQEEYDDYIANVDKLRQVINDMIGYEE